MFFGGGLVCLFIPNELLGFFLFPFFSLPVLSLRLEQIAITSEVNAQPPQFSHIPFGIFK